MDEPLNAALKRPGSRLAHLGWIAFCRSIVAPRQRSRSPCQVCRIPAGAGHLPAQRAGILLQLGPGFGAVLLLPFRIEPCFRQSIAEWGFIRVVEAQTLLLE